VSRAESAACAFASVITAVNARAAPSKAPADEALMPCRQMEGRRAAVRTVALLHHPGLYIIRMHANATAAYQDRQYGAAAWGIVQEINESGKHRPVAWGILQGAWLLSPSDSPRTAGLMAWG
jgi:hypothetical protein